jgi:pimeloyl-ACP methyl ester carboxylesterase
MKKQYYFFVIVMVGLLALFSISQLSTAQNKSEAGTENENQKVLQITNLIRNQSSDNIWTQINNSIIQQKQLEQTNNTSHGIALDLIGNSNVAEPRCWSCIFLKSAANSINTPSNLAIVTPSGTLLEQFVQQGPKLVGTDAVGNIVLQGSSVSLSADGGTAIVGGYYDNNQLGAAWVWIRTGEIWTRQGPKLVGSDATGSAQQGHSVSLSADGNTAIVGSISGARVWTRSGENWSQQGPRLVTTPSGAILAGNTPHVALSADGNTAIFSWAGTAVWTRSNGVWTQQLPKLWDRDAPAVAISADGYTAIVGRQVWTRSGETWSQQGQPLGQQGTSVSLSADGNTVIIGHESGGSGAAGTAWVFTRSDGIWTQQGPMLTLIGSGSGTFGSHVSVSLSADGNIAIVGATRDNGGTGASWVWKRSGGVWTQQGIKLVGADAVGNAYQGRDVSISADGNTAMVGGYYDNNQLGAAWVFINPNPSPTPVVFSVSPFSPASSTSDQDVFVSGINFKPNLTVDITSPGGAITTLGGEQIQNVTEASFIMRATLNVPGNWSIKVKNPDFQQSAAFAFTVASGGPSPFITSINPASPIANGADQYVTVTGGNFQNGLRVNATFPSGGIATLQGTGQIQNVTATSFKLKITLNTDGAWKIRVVNPDNTQSSQFAFTVQPSGPPPTGLPTSVLSPVIGQLRITTSNLAIADGKWQFQQHKTGAHTATGGISLSNDTYAWDADLFTSTSTNADAGKAVFATAPGQVVSYVGTPPGGGPGAVLIAHPNAAAPVWFSGYMHMTNVRVTLNQVVDSTTLIGEVGRAGATSENLHFVVYSGTNTRGNLQSFNTVINERSSTATPTISLITPTTVVQGDQLQPITLTGSNFAADAILEVEQPNGNSFQVTPQTITGFTDSSVIERIAATSITANVRFAFSGNYKFAVINRSTGARSSGICPQICVTVTAGSLRTPVILIPGIMGSVIARRDGTSPGQEIWPATAQSDLHRQLMDGVQDPDGPYIPILQRPVVATRIVETIYGTFLGVPYSKDVYGNLISWLTTTGGYREYYPVQALVPTCDTSQADKDLFYFAYDWRNSNWTSARDLDQFVQCIKNTRGNPPNFKVRIVAHSMGGLVARRYILNKTEDHLPHYVDRMVSLGTPWLGAPEIIQALEDGTIDFEKNRFILKSTVHEIAPYLRGPHELIPSYAYTDVLTGNTLGSFPFGESGWDFNINQRPETDYDFATLKSAMNQFGHSPGTHTDGFHSLDFDDWTRIDTGVDYYNFFGRSANTIGTLIATRTSWGDPILQTLDWTANGPVLGDGTVPEVSSRRIGRSDYRGPRNVERRFDNLNHGGLASNRVTFPSIKCALQDPNPTSCLGGQLPLAAVVEAPTYNLKVIGSNSVVFADSYGNTSNPLSTSMDEGIDTISSKVSGNSYVNSTIPLDQTYSVTITVPNTPFSIILLKNDGQAIVQAIRYVDISLPPNVKALIQLSPQGVTTLAYDSNGDGTFDIPVNPTIVVTGTQSQDIEPPQLNVNETVQGGNSRIDLEATDAGTGVQTIMYSLNGTTFQQYSTTLILNAVTNPTIYAYADDNVFNRSGLVTHNLTSSNVGFSVNGPSSAPAGGQINASWNAPAGRPVDDWIGLFRVGTLNSAYVSKQYTGGLGTGNLNFVLPNQPGTYEFRYLLNDGFSSVGVSAPIIVLNTRHSPFDFDSDGKTDVGVFRPSDGSWWYVRSIDNAFRVYSFGASTDKIVPGDYTGDGKTDIAVFRPSTGEWFVQRSEDNSYFSFPFGTSGDIPAPADYDGDGKTDVAIFRPSNATWYISLTTGGTSIVQFGASADKPVTADYDGDGKSDIAIFRPSDGSWWYLRSSDGSFRVYRFGVGTDKPVQGDYTGDGKADIAVFRPSTGEWFIQRSEDNSFFSFPFGASGDVSVPGDYDGDGKTDASVFRPSNSTWFLNQTTAGVGIVTFGITGDQPVPNAFVP